MLLALTGLELLLPLIQKRVIDEVIAAGNRDLLASLIITLVALLAMQSLCSIGDNYFRHVIGQRFIFDLRVRIYAYLQRLSLSFYEKTSTGELMSRVTNDVNALERFITHGSTFLAIDFLRLIGAAIVLLLLNPQLALLVSIPVPILALSLRYFNTRVRPIYRSVRDRLGDINARLQDSITGMRVIQAFSNEERDLSRFKEESESYYHAQVRGIRLWSTFFPAMHFLSSFGTMIVLSVGAVMVLNGSLTLGSLVAFISYLHFLYGPISRLVEIDNVFQDTIAAGERIFELFDAPPDITDLPGAVDLTSTNGEVGFQNVSFHYDTGDEVLHEVSFHMHSGEIVALVGPSGAGKTSIANLICRFYDPSQGCITLDDQDLRMIKLASLRRLIAVVLQDTFLFNTTIRENLLIAKPEASDAELEAAARAAFAHDFIVSLPDQYNTEIGERGVRLSGGQKQRLALARAILANPRILILDEATSSVDAEAEYLIQQALDSVLHGRTALVIAHRLSTVRNADKIIALESGRVVEIGDHEDLLQRGGLYSNLYQRQMKANMPEDGNK
jgi:subfamily B ATP-binding cassette protein MsbA